jgi:hypothetical protein
LWLTVPVQRKGHLEKKISEIEVMDGPWPRKHWAAIQHNYSKAPYFKLYADFFEETYKRAWKTLDQLNLHMLRWFLETLNIRVPIKSMGEFSFSGKKSDLVLDMCVTLGADLFIFGALGRDYADLTSFEHAGVKTEFQDYQHPTYPQLYGAFASHLSVIDLLFNCGNSSLDVLMSGNLDRISLLEKHKL